MSARTGENAGLLAAYDAQPRGAPPALPVGAHVEHDGPLFRIVGQYRGFVGTPRDTGLRGADLDRQIARQRDYFADRSEAVEWKTRGHDLPADLPDRLTAAGFVPEERETVLIAHAAPPHAACGASRSTPPTTAPPSCAGWASLR